MLFRTRAALAFGALALLATGCAAMLIVSAQRSERNQMRTDLAHANLSGYHQLSASVFRTFKQARRDLISGSGAFAFDIDAAEAGIRATLDRIERTARAEAALSGAAFGGPDLAAALRADVTGALADIRAASALILSGRGAEGRALTVDVLQGRVDVAIARSIEAAIASENRQLTRAQDDIRAFHAVARVGAWCALALAALVSALILLTLARRLGRGLHALDTGARAYAAGDMGHAIALDGDDELSAVAGRLTAMARQITAKRTQLENARADLERRVIERTAELSRTNAALRERDDLRRRFFADIGHELRTPVTAIRGEAEVALRAKRDRADAQEAALRTIVTLSEDLTSNVADLFLIAREQAGVLDFRVAPLDLAHPVSLGIEQMQSLRSRKSARMAVDLAPFPVLVDGDAARLAQLVRLLVSNALEHGPDGVRIVVSTRREGEDGVLTVCDDGPGIPPADRPRIFDRYAKGANAAGHAASSTGLGLAIARSIVQAHGGTIRVTDGPEGGACLVARFPLSSPPPFPPEKDPVP